MNGNNNTGFTNYSQQTPNNWTIFYPNTLQQNNFINFQIQNQAIYNQNQPQFPNQPPFQNPMAYNNNRQPVNDNLQPDFDDFLNQAEQYSDNSIAESSKRTYQSSLNAYQVTMEKFHKDPFPITIDKLKVFITYQAYNNITLNTLQSYITGLSYYFRSNNLINLTLTNDFKKFKNGLKRAYKENTSPFAKLPFKPEFFLRYLELNDMSEIENVRMMFYMSLSFYAFLRISELLNLRKKDIVYDVARNKLIINIRFSKTDQTGHGFTTYLYNNTNKCYHPLNFIGFIANLKDDDLIVNIKEDYLRRKLNDVLSQLGLDKNLYSWHSFRRGGATLASQHHIDPAIIKTHGRWLSEAYLLYVDNDHDSAGLQISDIL